MEQAIIITCVRDHYGFAVRRDNGEAVYIPASLVRNFDLKLDGEYKAKLVRNHHDISGRTPWFCGFIFMSDVIEPEVIEPDLIEPEAEPEPEPEPEVTREEMMAKVFDILSIEGAFSTGEMSKRLRSIFSTADAYTARQLLVKLFSENRIVRADIYKSSEQKRASLTIWAVSIDDIFDGDHCND